MNFLESVNRILRINGLIRGDTDPLTSFAAINHNSTSQLAQISVQAEITEQASKGLLPYQHTIQSQLVMALNTRSYSFPVNFIQLWGEPPFFYDTVGNYQIYEYPGGENELRNNITSYRTDVGTPLSFYFELGPIQKVAFYPVPDVNAVGRVLTYDYSASVNVLIEGDVLPFTTLDQAYAFCAMAERRFKFLFEGKVDMPIDQDPVYREARAALYSLIKGKQPATRYGSVYRSASSEAWPW